MTNDIAKFASTLEIPDLHAHARALGLNRLVSASPRTATVLASTDEKASASLIKGQVTAFTAGMAGQDKQDIEYTTLAAQLNSDKVVSDNQSIKGMKDWFKNYSSVMSNLGWIMSFDWEQFHSGSQGLSMDQVVLEVLAAVASQNDAAIAKAAMDALKKLPTDGDRMKLFSNSTTGDKAGKFLLGVASKDGESISLAFGAFAMDFQTRDTTVLWVNWKSSDVNIYKDQKIATFNQHYYAEGGRKTLESRMQGHVASYVAELDLGF